MNTIKTDQNKPEFIQLLKAQRFAYTISKRCSIAEYVLISFSMVLPFVLIFKSALSSQSLIIILSATLIVISILLDNFKRNRTSIAAKIQEEFDNKLFQLEWNDLLCEDKVENETIIRLAKKYQEFDLKNWYSKQISSELDHEIAVLFCQKSNVFWDKDLRKKYNFLLYSALAFYYLIFFIIGYIKNLQFENLTLLILPSFTFLKFQIQLISNQNQIIRKKEKITNKINRLFDNYAQNKIKPERIELRELQNAIFSLRNSANKIPDWFYKIFKDSFENLTDESIKMKITEITK